jgi:hypothetical protein
MELTEDTTSIIMSYMPTESFSELISLMPSQMANIGKSNLFWKQRVETLIEKYIDYKNINWKTIFLNLNKLLIEFKLDYKKAFIEACKRGDLDNVKLLIKSPKLIGNYDSTMYENISTIEFGLITAAQHGQYSIVDFLLLNPSIKSYVIGIAIGSAKWNNHHNIVKLLSEDSRYNPLIIPPIKGVTRTNIIGKRPQFGARSLIVPS